MANSIFSLSCSKNHRDKIIVEPFLNSTNNKFITITAMYEDKSKVIQKFDIYEAIIFTKYLRDQIGKTSIHTIVIRDSIDKSKMIGINLSERYNYTFIQLICYLEEILKIARDTTIEEDIIALNIKIQENKNLYDSALNLLDDLRTTCEHVLDYN